ncbi:MAG: shikimate dehydrogenase [Alphaproteobacteria bacterium]|nr:shikimate dehydrogenase [Alphaproteobacteria bacterium]
MINGFAIVSLSGTLAEKLAAAAAAGFDAVEIFQNRPDLGVADIFYCPLETELLRRARATGCRAPDGGGRAVFQAAAASHLVTGLSPDREGMLASFRASLPC